MNQAMSARSPRRSPRSTNTRVLALAAALLAAGLLAGCATPTPYEKPAVATPAAFKEDALWKRANPQAAAVPDEWWKLYADPVLDDLQARLVLNNQNLQAAVAQVRAAQAALASARAGSSPTLGATFNASRADPGAGKPANSFSLGASASWEVDLWGRLSGAVDAAGARYQASQDDLDAARLSARASLAQTYFSLRASESQTDTLERAVQAYEKSLELTRNRYQAGVVSAGDVAQAQAQLKSAQAQLIESRAQRAVLEHALAVLVGQAPSQFNLARTAKLPEVPAVPSLLPATLLERRPDIAAAERRVAAAAAQVGVAQAAFFPALTLSGGAGWRGAGIGNLVSAPNLFWSLGPQVVLAAFDGGARQAATDSARASVDQAAASYRQTVLTAFQEIEDNLVQAASLAEEGKTQAEALAAARQSLDIATNQYRAGTVSYLNVVSAQASVLSAERSLIDVNNRRLAAVNQLLKNIAGRWEAVPQAQAGGTTRTQAPTEQTAP